MLRVIILWLQFGALLPAYGQIDLHAHLDMKPGLGILLQGSFSEAPRANHWSDRIHTKVSASLLAALTKETRPKLIVATLYGHPYLGYSFARDGLRFNRKNNVRNGVEAEYRNLSAFVRDHSADFAFAKNAGEARAILKQGKTVIVLSLEGAWGTLDSTQDIHRWVDERGLAIVTPVHLTPDELGGNALMSAFWSLANSTMDFLRSVIATRGDCLKTYCKSLEGLSAKGNQIVDELMYRNVWLDLAHANDIEIHSILEKYTHGTPTSGAQALPLLVTHTQLRKYFPTERGLGDLEIDYVRKHDGIIGLIPTQQMMPVAMKNAEAEALRKHPEDSEKASAAQGMSCISSLDVFRTTFLHTIQLLGHANRVSLASDVNAPLDGLSPACGEAPAGDPAMLDLHRRGYYSYSQWNALTKFVTPPESADRALEHFLKLWERVRP